MHVSVQLSIVDGAADFFGADPISSEVDPMAGVAPVADPFASTATASMIRREHNVAGIVDTGTSTMVSPSDDIVDPDTFPDGHCRCRCRWYCGPCLDWISAGVGLTFVGFCRRLGAPLDGHETIRTGWPQANTFCLMYELALASGVSVAKLAIVSGVSVALVAKFPPTDAADFAAKVLSGKYLRPFELHSLMQPRRARAAYKRWKLRLHHHGSN